jgi:hypothetical protein
MRAGIRVGLRPFVAAAALVGFATFAAAQDAAFGTPEDQRQLIAGLCGTQLAIGPAACTCLAERAMTGLDENQRSYLILSVVQPPAAERLDIARSQEQLAAIFTFLETARVSCTASTAPAETPTAPQ